MKLKRSWLRSPGDEHIVDGHVYARPELARRASVAIARFAVDADGPGYRKLGDPIFEMITEGRAHAPGYYSCGDLGAFTAFAVGCRDERIINRSTDGGDLPWAVGQNLGHLVFGSGTLFDHTPGDVPPLGAILYVTSPEHVCILESWQPEIGLCTTLDYGQFDRKIGVCGQRKQKSLARVGKEWIVGGRVLKGFLDVALLPLDAAAIVPESFEGGEDLPPGTMPEPGIPLL